MADTDVATVPHTQRDLSLTVLTHRPAPLEEYCRACRQIWPCRSYEAASQTLREVYRV